MRRSRVMNVIFFIVQCGITRFLCALLLFQVRASYSCTRLHLCQVLFRGLHCWSLFHVREPKLLLRNIKTYVCIRMYVYVYVTCKPMTFTFTTSMNTFFILYYYTTLLNLYSAIGHVSTHWSHISLVYSRHSLPVVRPEYNRSLMSQQLRSTHTLCFQRRANYTTICNWITNYNWHNGEITKLQISNCKLLQITNYKFRFNSLQVCSMVFYGNKVSHLGQNNHYQLSVFNELLSTLADHDQKHVIFLQKHKRQWYNHGWR